MVTTRRLLLSCLLVLAPALANAETCTFASGASTWGPIGTITGAGVTGCTADSTDTFVVASGAAVTVLYTSDITQGTTASTGILVQSGGSLTAAVGAATTDEIAISTSDAGIKVEAGGSINLQGRLLCPYQSALTLSTTACPDYWYVSEIRFPAAATMRLFFSDVVHVKASGAQPGRGYHTESVARVQVGDVVCFRDDDESNDWAPMEEGYCYEVTAVNTAGDDYIDVSVRQGDRDQAATTAPEIGKYTLAKRDVVTTTLAANVIAGQRSISLAAAATAATDNYQGRCLYFENGTSATPEPVAYKIERITDGGGGADTVLLGRLGGSRNAHTSADDAWIGYCVNEGDPFEVMRPVVVTSSTAAQGDSRLYSLGASSISMALIDDLGGEGYSAERGGPIAFGTTATSTAFSRVWVRDASGVMTSTTGECNGSGSSDYGGAINDGNQVSVHVQSTSGAISVDHLTITGGDARLGEAGTACTQNSDTATDQCSCDRMHGLGYDNPQPGVSVYNVAVRYAGDDCIVTTDTAANGTSPPNMDRVRCQFSSGGGFSDLSQSSVDVSGHDVGAATIKNVDCTACIAEPGSFVLNTGETTQATPGTSFRNVVAWAAETGTGVGTDGGAAAGYGDYLWLYNLMTIGGQTSASTEYLPSYVDGFVVRETTNVDSGSFRNMWRVANTNVVEPRNLTNGLFVSNQISQQNFITTGDSGASLNKVQNVMIYNAMNNNTATCTSITADCRVLNVQQYNNPAVPYTLRDVSIVHVGAVAGTSDFPRPFYVAGTSSGSEDIASVLISGFEGAGISGSACANTWGANVGADEPFCFSRNGTDWIAGQESYVSNQIRDRVLGPFQSRPGSQVHRGSLAQRTGVSCGAKWNAGIPRLNWTHYVSGLDVPETAETLFGGGGGGGFVPRAF